MHRLCPFLLSLVTTWGCGTMTIEGNLVDGEGVAVDEVMVTIKGTECNGHSNSAGAFTLQCDPGAHTLVASKPGYLAKEFYVEATERQPYAAGTHTLAKLPEATGLFLFSQQRATPLKPGHLTRKHEGKGLKKTRAYCLDKDNSETNHIAPGMTPFLDHQARAWRPFRLDDQGCAYRDARNERGSWVVEYREKPDFEEKKLSDTMSIARIQLSSGSYFIADWKGFFEASKTKGPDNYGGYWITVGQ